MFTIRSLTCGGSLLDHLILVVGYVSRQAAGQEDPNELRHNRENTDTKSKYNKLIFVSSCVKEKKNVFLQPGLNSSALFYFFLFIYIYNLIAETCLTQLC